LSQYLPEFVAVAFKQNSIIICLTQIGHGNLLGRRVLPAPQTQTVQQDGLIAAACAGLALSLPAVHADRHAQNATSWVQLINIGLARRTRQDRALLLPSLQRQVLRATAKQSAQVQGAACFRACTRQALTTERLYAHHRAHHIAVHIDVTSVNARNDTLHGFIQTGVNAKGQSVTTFVDLIDQAVQLATLETHHVQNGTDNFALQILDLLDLDNGRQDNRTWQASALFTLGDTKTSLTHSTDVLFDTGAGFFINHRPHIGTEQIGIAHTQFLHS